MQENNRRLIDEALMNEPIKNTFRLAWEFITLNKNFTAIAMGIFIALNLFATIPLIAFIFMVFAAALGIAIQMHVGRIFYGAKDIGTYVEEIKSSRIDEILSRYMRTAFGVYVGWWVLILLLLFILGFVGAIGGVFHENMNESDVLVAVAGLGLPLILVAFAFSYVQPLVNSNIVLSNSFAEGFKAVFTLFSRDVWSSALGKDYLSYVLKVGLVLMAIIFSIGLVLTFLAMLPVIGLIGNLLLSVLMYIFMVFMSVMSMMARRIVEE